MKKCLIVEDEPALRQAYASAMRDMGFDVVEASTRTQAFYFLKTRVFALILLDLSLPDGSTLDLADYVQMRNDPTLIVVVTGTHLYPNGELAQIAPRIDFALRKPVNLTDLAAIAQRALEI